MSRYSALTSPLYISNSSFNLSLCLGLMLSSANIIVSVAIVSNINSIFLLILKQVTLYKYMLLIRVICQFCYIICSFYSLITVVLNTTIIKPPIFNYLQVPPSVLYYISKH